MLGTIVLYLHPKGSDMRPVFGIMMDNQGEVEILLSYSDMRDWGIIADDFPKVKPMGMQKVESKKKIMTGGSPKKALSHPLDQSTGSRRKILDKSREESINQCNERLEDQNKAKKLHNFSQKEFYDIFKENLEQEDRMHGDPAELVLINKEVQPHYSGPLQRSLRK